VRVLAVSPSGKLAASGGLDRTVIVWDLDKEKELCRIDGLPGEVWSLRFAPDNRRLFTSSESSLFEHDVTTGKKIGKERSPAGHVCPDGTTMLSFDATANPPVTRFLNLADMSELGQTTGLAAGPYHVSFDQAGKNALVFGEGEVGLHLDLTRRKPPATLSGKAARYRIVSTCWVRSPGEVLLGTKDGSLIRFSFSTATHSQRIGAPHEGAIRSIDVSPDGKLAASTCDNVHVFLTDIESRKHAGTFSAHKAAPNKVLFCLAGKKLVSAGEDNLVILWDVQKPTSEAPPTASETPGRPKEVPPRDMVALGTIRAPQKLTVTGASFAPEGTRTITAMGPFLLVHDLEAGNQPQARKLDFPVQPALVLTKDRKRCLTVGANNTLVVFEVAKDDAPKPLGEALETAPSCLALSPDGKYGLLGAGPVVRLLSLTTGKVEHSFNASTTPITAVTFTDDGKHVVAASQDATLRIWEVESKKLLHTLPASPTLTPPVKIAPAGNSLILLGSGNGMVRLFDCEKGTDVKSFKGQHEGAVAALAVSPDLKSAFSVGAATRVVEGRKVPGTPTMRMWDLNKGVEVVRVNLPALAQGVDVSPDGKYLLLSETSAVHCLEVGKLETGEGTAPVVYNLKPGKEAKLPLAMLRPANAKPFQEHEGLVNSVHFSSTGELLSAGADGKVCLWAPNGKLKEVFTNPNGLLLWARFARTDRNILAIGQGPNGHFWQISDPDADELLPYPSKAQATCGDISSDGKTIMLGALDALQTINLRNGKVTGNVESKLVGGDGVPLGDATAIVALGPVPRAAQLFAVGTSLGYVAIWNVAAVQADGSVKGQCVTYLKLHEKGVLALACYPRSKLVASVSADRSITMHSYDEKKLKTKWYQRQPKAHDEEITSVAFSPNGVYLLTGSRDRSARMWTHTGAFRLVKKYDVNGEVLGVAYSPDGKRLAICGKAIRLHSLE
jgi:WD40 repeat protein